MFTDNPFSAFIGGNMATPDISFLLSKKRHVITVQQELYCKYRYHTNIIFTPTTTTTINTITNTTNVPLYVVALSLFKL